MFTLHRNYEYTATAEKWLSILESADRWEMQKIRAAAIGQLSRLTVDPFVKLDACLKYDINPDWALDAFVHVCGRRKKVSREEGERLGSVFMVIVADAREQIAAKKSSSPIKPAICSGSVGPYCNQCRQYYGNKNCRYCSYIVSSGEEEEFNLADMPTETIVKKAIENASKKFH